MNPILKIKIMQEVKAENIAALCQYDKKDLAEVMILLYQKYCNAEARANLINNPLANIADGFTI